MLHPNHPAISYIAWEGLVISDENNEQYIIVDGSSCKKYIYWERNNNPYVLRESDEWVEITADRKMIFINDNGEPTEVPQDTIDYYFTNKGSSSGVITGEMLGKFDAIDGKFMTIEEDIDGIHKVLGDSSTEGNSLIDRVTKVEQTAEGITETIKEDKITYENDKYLNELRENLSTAIIDTMNSLSKYNDNVVSASKDLTISTEESNSIKTSQEELTKYLSIIDTYHNELVAHLGSNTGAINSINTARETMKKSINNLNTIVNTSISSGTLTSTSITTMLNSFANASLKVNEYKNTIKDNFVLGIGGSVVENMFESKKTATEFNQQISAIEYEIDGETGLKNQIQKNATAIQQTADNLSLNYIKYDGTKHTISVNEQGIKLDAGLTLMTGTLTWDSLDDEAKENLKGEDGSAEYVMLVGEQIFKYDKLGNPITKSIVLSVQLSNITNPVYKWYYKRGYQWISISNTASNYTITHDMSAWNGEDTLVIRVEVNGFYDEMTLVKLYDGQDGINGSDGQNAQYVKVTGGQLFKYDGNTPTPSSITLVGERYNMTLDNSKWYCKRPSSSTWTEIISARDSDELTILPTDTTLFNGNNNVTIKYEVGVYSDQIQIAKLYNGANGQDGIYILITNESHNVPCDEKGNYEASELAKATTEIHAYIGTKETSFSLTKTDIGCTSVYNTSTKTLTITKLNSNTATVTMNIVVNGNTFTKIMTITKSLRGLKGEDGTGIQILGQFDSVSQLPSTGNPGDAYIVNGLIYVWSSNTNSWSDGVPFRGEQGIPGQDGADGRTTYVHMKYSDDGVTFTANNGKTPGKWLGQYTDFIKTDSTEFSDYTWIKIVGEDGDNGIVANLSNDSHLIPTDSNGNNGVYTGCISTISLSYNGVLLTSGVTYSNIMSKGVTAIFDSSTGTVTVTNLSVDVGYVDLKAIYNNVTYVKRFTVSKNKSGKNGQNGINGSDGQDGLDAYTINLSNDNHSFIADENGNITTQQIATISITAYKGTTAVTPTIGSLPTASGLTLSVYGTTITIRANIGASLSINGTLNIPITVEGKSFTKVFSWSKVNCGADSYTVYLTNENHSFVCESNGNITSAISTTTEVKAYKGTTAVTPTIGSLPTVSGLTLSVYGTTITIRANAGTSLASMGTFNIPIVVGGKSFTKVFSWSKTFKGANGQDGSMADLPGWITEWDNGKTTINGSTVLSPKIFAGTVSNGIPTGVAIGNNVFGTTGSYANINGIAGYKNGFKTYHLDNAGNLLIGSEYSQHIKWDGNNLEVVANKITLGGKGVATNEDLKNLTVGGVNLIDNSAPYSDKGWQCSSGWGYNLVECSSAPENTAMRFTNFSAVTGGGHCYEYDYTKCRNGERYTISAWIRASKSCKVNFKNEMMSSNNYVNVGTGWTYCVFTDVVNTWATYHSNIFYVTQDTCTTGMWLEVHSLKLEYGDKGTSWTKSLNDEKNKLSDLQNTLMNEIAENSVSLVLDNETGTFTLVVDGVNINYATDEDLSAVITDYNNKFTNLMDEENGGFAMIFNKKISEYGLDGMLQTTENVENHIDFVDDGTIRLYGSSTDFSLTLGQDKMSFKQGDWEVAYMSTEKLYITDGEFTNSMKIGRFKWLPRENGHLSFLYVG